VLKRQVSATSCSTFGFQVVAVLVLVALSAYGSVFNKLQKHTQTTYIDYGLAGLQTKKH